MTTIKSRFDMAPSHVHGSPFHDGPISTGPWLESYSRALSSLYPLNDDDCWDFLLSSSTVTSPTSLEAEFKTTESSRPSWARRSSRSPQRSDSFSVVDSPQQQLPTHDVAQTPNRRLKRQQKKLLQQQQQQQQQHQQQHQLQQQQQQLLQSKHHHHLRRYQDHEPQQQPPPPQQQQQQRQHHHQHQIQFSEEPESIALPSTPLMSLCSWGFDCIDYFTTDSGANSGTNPSKNTADATLPETDNGPTETRGKTTTMAQVDCSSVLADWEPLGVGAVLSGKRSNALHRRRQLSRSSSHESTQLSSPELQQDPWMQTFERLSRWDEVVYR